MHLSTESSLTEWLQYIEAIHPTEIDLGLDRLRQVCDRLLSPPTATVFTVAGTNGKGTTTASIAALAQASGRSVGWYTSPHLLRFNERIRLHGEAISDQELVNALARVEVARGDITLSYFEFTTLAAFVVFERANLDVWVLEVGLGGRLDAVNIIDPDVAVITNIGLDHQGFLGDTVDEIGREKAGICRPGKPLVLASEMPESVRRTAHEVGAICFQAGDVFGVSDEHIYWSGGDAGSDGITVPLANAAAAVQAVSLAGFELSDLPVNRILADIHMPGRMQRESYAGCSLIIDVGHNPHAATYIAQKLAGTQCHLILGMLADKDPAGFVAALQPVTKSLSLVTLDVPRGLSAIQFKERLGSMEAECFKSVDEAVSCLAKRFPGETLFIGGSFYTVCDALSMLESSVGI